MSKRSFLTFKTKVVTQGFDGTSPYFLNIAISSVVFSYCFLVLSVFPTIIFIERRESASFVPHYIHPLHLDQCLAQTEE